jgi:hypothetical protein
MVRFFGSGSLATEEIVGFLHADDLYASNDLLLKVAKG